MLSFEEFKKTYFTNPSDQLIMDMEMYHGVSTDNGLDKLINAEYNSYMERQKTLMSPLIPGTYPAISGSHVSKFTIDDSEFEASFLKAVKTFAAHDVITVTVDGKVKSKLLGEATEVHKKEVVYRKIY